VVRTRLEKRINQSDSVYGGNGTRSKSIIYTAFGVGGYSASCRLRIEIVYFGYNLTLRMNKASTGPERGVVDGNVDEGGYWRREKRM
jgi:hypothetical protein